MSPRSLVCAGLSSVLLAACPKAEHRPEGAPAAAVDAGLPAAAVAPLREVEPNETPESGQLLSASTQLSGELSPVQPATRPDEDWFQVRPSSPQDLSVTLTSFVGKATLELYDRDHNKILAQTGSAPLALPPVRDREVLFVRLAGAGSPAASGPYLLDFKLIPPDPDREAEPNDRPVDATPLPLDHPLKGTYGREGDQDFYSVELSTPAAGAPNPTSSAGLDAGPSAPSAAETAAGVVPNDAGAPAPVNALPPNDLLRIEVTGLPNIRHALTVFDEAGAPIGSFVGREPGAPLLVRDLPVRSGWTRVSLLLESAPLHKQRPFSDTPYAISVHREPAPADLELEPNDTFDLATPLGSAPLAGSRARRVGYLSPEGDVDLYKLSLGSAGRIHVSLSALDRVDTELSLLDPDPAAPEKGRLLLRVNEGGPKEPEVIPAITLAAGDHFVRVQAAAHQVGNKWVRDQSDPDQTYVLEVEVADDDGSFEREPNDQAVQATPIAVGQALSGYAFPAKDLDLYRLDLSTQPVATAVTIKLTGVPKVPLTLELRESDGNLSNPAPAGLLNSADPGKPGVAGTFQQKLQPGLYFLSVRPHPANRTVGTPQSDPDTPYQLSVTAD